MTKVKRVLLAVVTFMSIASAANAAVCSASQNAACDTFCSEVSGAWARCSVTGTQACWDIPGTNRIQCGVRNMVTCECVSYNPPGGPRPIAGGKTLYTSAQVPTLIFFEDTEVVVDDGVPF